MEKQELINWIQFCQVKGIGSSKILKLLGIFGSFKRINSLSEEELFRSGVFTSNMIENLREIKKQGAEYFEFIISVCEREKITIIPFYSELYPNKLKVMSDAPLTLYGMGDLNLLKTKIVAVVGSRESSEESRIWAYNLSKELSKKSITIISGGAKGIDYEAHKASLDINGKTICVLGSGLLKTYPAENKPLFEKIKKEGLLLSEHPPLGEGDRLSLLRRNRIISGMSNCLTLVTSSTTGGSMTQLLIAHKQRIPIFCPLLSLNLIPNEGIKEAIEKQFATPINDINPILNEIKKQESFFSVQRTL